MYRCCVRKAKNGTLIETINIRQSRRSMIRSTESYSILTISYASFVNQIDQNDLAGEVVFRNYNNYYIILHNAKAKMTWLVKGSSKTKLITQHFV